MNVLQVVVLLVVEVAEKPLEQDFRKPDDRVQRRAQLVRHVREKFGLVLVRDLELATLLLDFAEQPHVLDCDRCLITEGAQERDFALAERAHLLPAKQDRAERLSFAQQRRYDDGAMTEPFRELVTERIFILAL